MNMKNKIQKISHYIIDLLLILLWAVMMFFPAYMDTMKFKIFFSVSFACAMIYSFCKKKYFPSQKYSKTEKIIGVFLIVLLFIRFILF